MRTVTIFVGADLAAHPLITPLERDAILEHFAGRVYWCTSGAGPLDEYGVSFSADLSTLVGRVLARSPEAAGRVVLVSEHAATSRDWLRSLFPSTPICAVRSDVLAWPGAARFVAAVEAALDLVTAEEPW